MKIHRLIVGSLQANCYIVETEKKRCFIIDPGDDAPKILTSLKKYGCAAQFIVNTHGHIDHIRADVALSLPVYIHQEDRFMVTSPEKNMMSVFFGSFDPVQPARLLADGDELALDELAFRVIHTPGHSRGSLCLFGHGVLFSGDTLFKHGIGRTDFPGASETDMQASLKKLAALPPKTIVYPGHGPETTIGEEFHGSLG